MMRRGHENLSEDTPGSDPYNGFADRENYPKETEAEMKGEKGRVRVSDSQDGKHPD